MLQCTQEYRKALFIFPTCLRAATAMLPRSIIFSLFLLMFGLLGEAGPTNAAPQELTVTTVTRPPFSMEEGGTDTGFTIDLLNEVARRLQWQLSIERVDGFAQMLDAVESGRVDMAAANISITAQREAVMDFTQPIFDSGLQIMVHADDTSQPSLLRAVFSWNLLEALAIAFVLLLVGGMLMWLFERRAQPYFDRPLSQAWFPSFWWALNLVVNGGFEERVPRSFMGRIFGVLLVLSSLFVVSVFVAKITAAMTVEAITGSVQSVNDLYGKRVGTITASTAAGFLERREIDHESFDNLTELFASFEKGDTRIVVFDAPVLQYYANTAGRYSARIIGNKFLTEDYGFLFPQGSVHVEETNRALLEIQEDGTYRTIYRKWFADPS